MATSWHAEDASEVCGYRVSECVNSTEGFYLAGGWRPKTSLTASTYANSWDQYSPWGYKVQARTALATSAPSS
jgi:hypothetical protein